MKAVDRFVLEHEKMRPLMLSNTEWKFLEQLGSILEVSLLFGYDFHLRTEIPSLGVHQRHLPNVAFRYTYVAVGNPDVSAHAGITQIQY